MDYFALFYNSVLEFNFYLSVVCSSNSPTRSRRSINAQNFDNDPSHKGYKIENLSNSSESSNMYTNTSLPYKNISGGLKNLSKYNFFDISNDYHHLITYN